MTKRKKIGLALGSGGVKGLAHVGVLKTLLKHKIPIDFIAGSSVGAWIAAHYGLFQDIEKLELYTVHKKKDKFYIFLEPTLKGGIVKGNRLETLISNWLDNASFSDTKIPIRIIATDLVNGEPVIFSEGKLSTAVRASLSIPTLFKPVEFQNKILIDGGTSNPVPDDIARNMGADIVISVNLDNFQKSRTFKTEDLTLKRTANRSLDIMRHFLAEYSLKHSDFIIEPHIPDIGLSSWAKYFKEKIGPEIVKIGEKETEKIIDKIKKVI